VNHWNGRCQQNERKGTKGRDDRICGEIEAGDEVSTSRFAPVTDWHWHSLTGVSQAQLSTTQVRSVGLPRRRDGPFPGAGLSSLLQKWGSGGGVRLQVKGGKKAHKSLLCARDPVKQSLSSLSFQTCISNSHLAAAMLSVTLRREDTTPKHTRTRPSTQAEASLVPPHIRAAGGGNGRTSALSGTPCRQTEGQESHQYDAQPAPAVHTSPWPSPDPRILTIDLQCTDRARSACSKALGSEPKGGMSDRSGKMAQRSIQTQMRKQYPISCSWIEAPYTRVRTERDTDSLPKLNETFPPGITPRIPPI